VICRDGEAREVLAVAGDEGPQLRLHRVEAILALRPREILQALQVPRELRVLGREPGLLVENGSRLDGARVGRSVLLVLVLIFELVDGVVHRLEAGALSFDA
jgi:hypothetical protein